MNNITVEEKAKLIEEQNELIALKDKLTEEQVKRYVEINKLLELPVLIKELKLLPGENDYRNLEERDLNQLKLRVDGNIYALLSSLTHDIVEINVMLQELCNKNGIDVLELFGKKIQYK